MTDDLPMRSEVGRLPEGRWHAHLKVGQDKADCVAGRITVAQLAGIYVIKLRALQQEKPHLWDEEIEQIVDEFETIRDDGANATVRHFDGVCADLYDWADYDKRLWVEPEHYE